MHVTAIKLRPHKKHNSLFITVQVESITSTVIILYIMHRQYFLHILYIQKKAIAGHETQRLMHFAFMLFVFVFLVFVFVFTLILLLVVMLVSAASLHWLVVIRRHMAVTALYERGQHRL